MFKYITLCLLMVACTNMPSYEPENNEEYIEQLEAITDQEIKVETSRTYAYTGIALVIAGVALGAFAGRYKSALVTGVVGVVLMTFPFVFNSEYFDWIAGIFISFLIIYGLVFLYKFQINKNKSNNNSV